MGEALAEKKMRLTAAILLLSVLSCHDGRAAANPEQVAKTTAEFICNEWRWMMPPNEVIPEKRYSFRFSYDGNDVLSTSFDDFSDLAHRLPRQAGRSYIRSIRLRNDELGVSDYEWVPDFNHSQYSQDLQKKVQDFELVDVEVSPEICKANLRQTSPYKTQLTQAILTSFTHSPNLNPKITRARVCPFNVADLYVYVETGSLHHECLYRINLHDSLAPNEPNQVRTGYFANPDPDPDSRELAPRCG